MSTSDAAIRKAILATLPTNGEKIGNLALLAALKTIIEGVAKEDYCRVRDALLAEGFLVKGKGRGGSVSRADPNRLVQTSKEAKRTARKTKTPKAGGRDTLAYQHTDEAVQRPDVGMEVQFSHHKPSKTYRYDSSIAPELNWDESGERAFVEWLLALVSKVAEKGEDTVFANPKVWRDTGESFTSLLQCVVRLRSFTQPFLNWSGKAEHQMVTVPTLPLFVHERHSAQVILETLKSHRAREASLSLFSDSDLDITDKLDAYQHKGPWVNRLILGDSLQVMNSLLEYEGMGEQVQMIYFDPPYGIKFGSNFQPFVRKTTVKHGADDAMIREPEMVKAYRDTWELGLHSYLTYLRDRLALARNVLKTEGSIFVQISDDNVHHVKELMDEIFGPENFVALISFRTKIPLNPKHLAKTADYIVWYAKDKSRLYFHRLYLDRDFGGGTAYTRLEEANGTHRPMTKEEKRSPETIPKDAKPYKLVDLTASGYTESCHFEFTLEGKTYRPPKESNSWKTNQKGMEQLIAVGRIIVPDKGSKPSYKCYYSDYPVIEITSQWEDTAVSTGKIYAVQTAAKVIERCVHMTTEPGDLIMDITCGSATSPFVAEKWGRRWIAIDTSRVPIALARQRLLTEKFPWWKLKDPSKGPAGGFVYERKFNKKGRDVGGLVPHITLGDIANDVESPLITRVDKPEEDKKITRVCGPFTVEATIQPAMDILEDNQPYAVPQPTRDSRIYLDRMIDVLRQSKTLHLPSNEKLTLDSVRPLANCEYLHAGGGGGQRRGTDHCYCFRASGWLN